MKANKKYLIVGGGLILTAFLIFSGDSGDDASEIIVPVKHGLFEVKVFTTGELEAKNSVEIKGPAQLRSVGIWRIQITDLIPEGSKVKKGDYIALLDKSEISGKISDAGNNLSKAESKYIQTRLDTALQLREARDKITDMEFSVRENIILLEQSAYEPPATIRQANISLDKAKRSYEESKETYQLKLQQSIAKMQEASAELNQSQYKLKQFKEVETALTILATEDGMVIYSREWNGKKRTTGSEIGTWDPTVATLPDLSSMISKTYINEVDVRKIEQNQSVEITLDAFPDKKLSGKVISVANVGEQLPNADAKVFEVRVQLNETDTMVRPGMTTGNSIIARRLEDVLYVPLEAIHNQGDTLSYVFKRSGWSLIKQEIMIGETNENFAEITKGLEETDNVLLSVPQNPEDLKIMLLSEKT